MAGIIIVAHAPLAQTLLKCAEHVYENHIARALAFDITPDADPANMAHLINQHVETVIQLNSAILLTDLCGATPANISAQVARERNLSVLAGVNLPMLLKAIAYRSRPIEVLIQAALAGGTQGVMRII